MHLFDRVWCFVCSLTVWMCPLNPLFFTSFLYPVHCNIPSENASDLETCKPTTNRASFCFTVPTWRHTLTVWPDSVIPTCSFLRSWLETDFPQQEVDEDRYPERKNFCLPPLYWPVSRFEHSEWVPSPRLLPSLWLMLPSPRLSLFPSVSDVSHSAISPVVLQVHRGGWW